MNSGDTMARGGGATARFEFRLRPEAKARIEYAAGLMQESASDFARSAAEERAEQVIRDRNLVTWVPPDYFEALLSALDEPAQPNSALTAAAERARKIVKRT